MPHHHRCAVSLSVFLTHGSMLLSLLMRHTHKHTHTSLLFVDVVVLLVTSSSDLQVILGWFAAECEGNKNLNTEV